MKKNIVLTIDDDENGEIDLAFTITLAGYNQYINQLTPNNKIQPSHNFLMACVDDKSKPKLREMIKQPGIPVMLASELVNDYQADVTITVKKSKDAPEKSKATA